MSGGHITQVEFGLADDSFPFISVTDEYDCTVKILNVLPSGTDGCTEFVRVSGTEGSAVAEFFTEFPDVESHPISVDRLGGTFEFTVPHWCPVSYITRNGGIVRTVRAKRGTATIVAEVLPDRNPKQFVSDFLETYSASELNRKVTKDRSVPVLSNKEVWHVVRSRLTSRQLEVIEVAYNLGYYEQPKRATGSEVADRLNISQSTFCQHLRRAEQEFMRVLFEST